MSIPVTKRHPVRTCLSGPSAGIAGALAIAEVAGFKDIITLDMGGTSTDVCLVKNLKANVSTGKKVAGFPVQVPMIDVHAVGAGGGSIAWVDSGGILQVGAQSAGAVTGPACYGRGGEEATVTDANVTLGRLNPEYMLGGEMKVNHQVAHDTLNHRLGKHLNMDEIETAFGIIKIVNS